MGKMALVVNDVLIGTSSVVTIIHCQIGRSEIGEGGHIRRIIGGDLGQLVDSLLHACGGLPSVMACCVVLCVSVHLCVPCLVLCSQAGYASRPAFIAPSTVPSTCSSPGKNHSSASYCSSLYL